MDRQIKSSEIIAQEFLSSLYKNLSSPLNCVIEESSDAEREYRLRKKMTLAQLDEYRDRYPQFNERDVFYVIVKGFARHLILCAEEILPAGGADVINTAITSYVPMRDLPENHGDIDIVFLKPSQRDHFWSNVRQLWGEGLDIDADSSVRTYAASLLGMNDFTKPEQHDSNLARYYCFVVFNGKKYLIPRPEVLLFEYQGRVKDDLFEYPKPEFLRQLLAKYRFDNDLIAELSQRKLPETY